MKNSRFSVFFVATLLALPRFAWADLSVAKEVEEMRVHFESSKSGLSPDSKIILDQTLSLLSRMNEPYSIKIMGFTDGKGSEEINQNLSVQRANAVASYLIGKGIDRNRILIQGLGRESPTASNDTEEGRMRNRRVQFQFITPDTSELKLTASNQWIASGEIKEPEILEIKPTDATSAPVPVAESAPESKVEPKVESKPTPVVEVKQEQPKEIEPEVVKERPKDTMLAVTKKRRNKYVSDHIYEDRKRSEAGQTYVQLTPMLKTMDGFQALGASDNRAVADIAVYGEAGWVSFLEESFDSYVLAKAYGSAIRFGAEASNLMASKQKGYSFGGELGIGRYFHPNVALQIQAGYGAEMIHELVAGSVELDQELIGHAGLTAEVVFWRFTKEGDLGLDGYVNYYDIGRGILNTGLGYGLDLFVDYDFLRVGVGFSLLNLEATTRSFNQWQFGPNIRLYF